jgi:hypothetical protein
MSTYARIRQPLPIPPMRVSPVQFCFGKQLEIMYNEYNCTYSIFILFLFLFFWGRNFRGTGLHASSFHFFNFTLVVIFFHFFRVFFRPFFFPKMLSFKLFLCAIT